MPAKYAYAVCVLKEKVTFFKLNSKYKKTPTSDVIITCTCVYSSFERNRVSWGSSDQNFEISFCFTSLSFISHCEEIVLGP
jgi:hypothetical protein